MIKNCRYCLLPVNFLFFSIILLTNALNPVEAKIDDDNIYKEKGETISATTLATNESSGIVATVNQTIDDNIYKKKNEEISASINLMTNFIRASGNSKIAKALNQSSINEDGSEYKNDNFLDNMLKQYSPCKCEAASIMAQNGLKSTHQNGIMMFVESCNAGSKKGPITLDECNKFYNIYGELMNIPSEFVSKDVMCNLIHGECGSKKEPAKIGPVNCAFCKLLHRRAHAITSSFAKFFDIFNLMCDRLEEADKKLCYYYVKHEFTDNLKPLLDYNFDKLATSYCEGLFKCKE